MIPSQLIKSNHSQIMEIIQRFPVKNPKVFSSIAKDLDKESSDLDLCGLQIELEDLLGVKVDILTPRSLPEKLNQIHFNNDESNYY